MMSLGAGNSEMSWLEAHRAAVIAKRAQPDTSPAVEAEIRDLLVAYATCYDCQDVDGVLDVFSEDAEYTTLLGTFRGRSELRENYEGLIEKFYRTAHLMTNHTVCVDSPTEARAFSYLHGIVQLKNGTAYTLVGSYQDKCERRGGRWYIVKREVFDGVSAKMRPLDAEMRLSQLPEDAW